ncbi:MAG: response regulator [Acidobacteriaceae bacterium]|nr:response regulator [Acidobacteriaceae bacterium]
MSGVHILVIEDNPGDVRLIQEALRSQTVSFRMTHYDTADRALKAVHRYQPGAADVPDIMLVDFNLPAGNATDILIAAAKNPALARIKKAVMTSSVAPKDRDQAILHGADCFIFKPADLDGFLNEVGGALRTLCDEVSALSAGRPSG